MGGLPGQEKPPNAPEPEEASVLALGAKELDAFAQQAQKAGFSGRAKVAWLEVIAEYAPDDASSRKALGYQRQGTAWFRDPKFVFPDQDQPSPAAAKSLEQKWTSVAQRLGEAHRTLAAQLAAANKAERGRYHAARALRFLPNDAKAIAQAGMRQIEGITGDDIDLAVLQRSRKMDRAIQALSAKEYAVEPSDDKLAILDGIVPSYHAVRSDNFTVFGDLEPEVMQEAAMWAERALAFCQEAYDGFPDFAPKGAPKRKFVYLKDKPVWDAVIRKHHKNDAEFVVAHARSSEIGEVKIACADHPELVFDHAVRWVAKDYSGLRDDALVEGIGHAIVGMFFGQNLVFTVGKADDKVSVAGGKQTKRFNMPDLETWRELAVELAFQKSGTTAAKLPLLEAADFPLDARIKAWSFCDYLLRRDPQLLKRLQAAGNGSKGEQDVVVAFQEKAGHSLLEVEQRWRRFWTEDTPLRRAVLMKTTPLEAASREAPQWLELFNKLRQQAGLPTVGWSAQLSMLCKEHVDYLKLNKDQRGPVAEATQVAGKPGSSNAGRGFAATALVWTRDAKRASDQWLLLPGFRDAILNPNLETVGIYVEAGLVVMDVMRDWQGRDQVTPTMWPKRPADANARPSVPSVLDVELLGPEALRHVPEDKRAKTKQVGYPLTLHTYGVAGAVTCKVSAQGSEIAGTLVPPLAAGRRTSAPGMWVFWPAGPLPRGGDITVHWTGPGTNDHTVTFVAQ